jgi:hypothetical protein
MSVKSEFIYLGYVKPFKYTKDGESRWGFLSHFCEVANGSTEGIEPLQAMVFAGEADQDSMQKMRDWLKKVQTFKQGQKVTLEWKPGRGRNRYEVLDIIQEEVPKKGPTV